MSDGRVRRGAGPLHRRDLSGVDREGVTRGHRPHRRPSGSDRTREPTAGERGARSRAIHRQRHCPCLPLVLAKAGPAPGSPPSWGRTEEGRRASGPEPRRDRELLADRSLRARAGPAPRDPAAGVRGVGSIAPSTGSVIAALAAHPRETAAPCPLGPHLRGDERKKAVALLARNHSMIASFSGAAPFGLAPDPRPRGSGARRVGSIAPSTGSVVAALAAHPRESGEPCPWCPRLRGTNGRRRRASAQPRRTASLSRTAPFGLAPDPRPRGRRKEGRFDSAVHRQRRCRPCRSSSRNRAPCPWVPTFVGTNGKRPSRFSPGTTA